MNDKFKIPFGTRKGGLMMAIIFGAVAAAFTIIGFWKTVLILILAAAGYYVGSSANLKNRILKLVATKIESHKNDIN